MTPKLTPPALDRGRLFKSNSRHGSREHRITVQGPHTIFGPKNQAAEIDALTPVAIFNYYSIKHILHRGNSLID